MLRNRRNAVDAVRKEFCKAWHSADRAALNGADCIAEMLRVREAANLPINTGTELLEKMVQALNASIEARRSLIEASELAPGVIKQLGLARMFGDVSPCPPTDREARLFIVRGS
jgi:hypothetical protein